jgi:serine/threonine protein phosphatase PrpC
MYSGFSLTQLGYSHKEKGTPCQDAAAYKVCGDYAIAALSDGHGGEKYIRSGDGSNIAVKTAIHCLEEFSENYRETLTDPRGRDKRLKDIAGHVIYKWRKEIEKHFTENPLDEREKEICAKYGLPTDIFQDKFYGATLIYTCLMPDQSFASQLGDGACVIFKTGENPEKLPTDPRLGFGVTSSLCDSDALGNFLHHIWDTSAGLPKSVILYSDGVVDSYEPNSFLVDFNTKILDDMRKDKGATLEQLKILLPYLSEKGSEDDMSMAGVFSVD